MLVKHAYLIIAHNDIELLQVLVDMLDDERNDIYIHPDKKWVDFDERKLRTLRANLFILPNRIKGYWGHISLMQIEYALFRYAREHSGQYAYYHLLSGADLPIKSQDYIHTFFSDKSMPFISYWDHKADTYYKVSRYTFGMSYERTSNPWSLWSRSFAFLRRKLADYLYYLLGSRPGSRNFYKGANWVSLPVDCVDLLLSSEHWSSKRLRFTRNPDEIFAQTILYHNFFAPQGIDPSVLEDLRLVNWKSSTISPDYFTIEQWDEILASPALFARKFSTSVDAEIIERIHKTFG